MTATPSPLSLSLGFALTPPVQPPFVVARGAGHDRSALRRAERLGAVAGAAVRVAHGRVEVGASRRGPLERRERLELGELLDTAHPRTKLMLDLRGLDPRLPRLLSRALAAVREREVIVCSRSWWMLEPLRRHPRMRCVPIVATSRQLGALLRRCDTEPLDGVAVDASLLTPQTATALRAMCGMLLAWPANSPAEAARLRSLGVTGLITDSPAVALDGRAAGVPAFAAA